MQILSQKDAGRVDLKTLDSSVVRLWTELLCRETWQPVENNKQLGLWSGCHAGQSVAVVGGGPAEGLAGSLGPLF